MNAPIRRWDYEKMDDYIRASVTVERLDCLILDLLVWNVGPIKEFLASLLSPPAEARIDYSLRALAEMQAITPNGDRLTKYGRKLSNLHLDPQLGTMLIYAAIFKCLGPITTVAAFLSFKDVFMLTLGHSKARKDLNGAIQAGGSGGTDVKSDSPENLSDLMQMQLDLDGDQCSDHLIRVKAVQEYVMQAGDKGAYCQERQLNESTMVQVMAMRSQIIHSLARNKLIGKEEVRRLKSNNERMRTDQLHMIRSVICAGLCPNTAVYE